MTDSPSKQESAQRRARLSSPDAVRLLAWAGPALAIAVGAFVAHNGTLLLLAVTVCGSAALRRWLPLDVALPAATGLLVLLATALGLLADVTGSHLLASRPASTACLLVVVVAFMVVASRQRSRPLLPALPRSWWALIAFLPAAAMLVAATGHLFSSSLTGTWIALIKDTSEHAWFVRELRASGQLDYSVTGYPRGLHALAAWFDTVIGQPGDLLTQLRGVATLTFASFALMIGTLTALSMRFCAGRGARLQGLVGLSTGLILIASNQFVSQFVLAGAHASLLALTVSLLPAFLALVTKPRLRWRLLLVTLPLVAVLQAHLWTATVAASAAVWLLVVAVTLHDARNWRQRARELAWGVPSAVGAVVMIIPVLSALLHQSGVAIAGIPGLAFQPSLYLYGLAVIGIVVSAVQWRRPEGRVLVAVVLGFAAMTGTLLVGSGHPTDLTQWYPTKGVYFTLLAALPAGVAGLWTIGADLTRWVAEQTVRLGRWQRSANLVLIAAVGGGAILANGIAIWGYTLHVPKIAAPFAALAAKSAAAPGSMNLSERRITIAVEYGTRYPGAVTIPAIVGADVAMDKTADGVTSHLIRLQTGQPTNRGGLDGLCEQIATVASDRPAVVVTAAPKGMVNEALTAQGCPDVRVVDLPWPASYTPPMKNALRP